MHIVQFPDSRGRLYQYLDPSVYQMPKVWLPILSVANLFHSLFVWLRDHFLQEAFLELHSLLLLLYLLLWGFDVPYIFLVCFSSSFIRPRMLWRHFVPFTSEFQKSGTGSANCMLIKWMDNPVTHIMAENLRNIVIFEPEWALNYISRKKKNLDWWTEINVLFKD